MYVSYFVFRPTEIGPLRSVNKGAQGAWAVAIPSFYKLLEQTLTSLRGDLGWRAD